MHKHTIASIITSDASSTEYAQRSMHYTCIKDVLFAESKLQVYEFSLARCRAFGERKIPAVNVHDRSNSQPLLVLLLGNLWPMARAADITSLFHVYVAAGIIDVDSLMPKPYATGSVQVPPLESAVRSYRNLDAMVALIEAGADEKKVPSEPFRPRDSGPVLAAAGDFLEFARNQTSQGPEFFAAAKAAIMRRAIAASTSRADSEAIAPTARRRRSPSV